jgi:hypothetical protein
VDETLAMTTSSGTRSPIFSLSAHANMLFARVEHVFMYVSILSVSVAYQGNLLTNKRHGIGHVLIQWPISVSLCFLLQWESCQVAVAALCGCPYHHLAMISISNRAPTGAAFPINRFPPYNVSKPEALL